MPKPDLLFVADKDPNFVYHWFNNSPSTHGDFNMISAQELGWDPVMKDPTSNDILSRIGQSDSTPAGGAVRRGDLVLMRMPREQWERTIHAETLENQRRMDTTVDTMVLQANENARKALRDRGQSAIPAKVVFRDDPSIPSD